MSKRIVLIGDLSDTCRIALDRALDCGLVSDYCVFSNGMNIDDDCILMKGYIHSEDFLRTVIKISKDICVRKNLPKPFLTHCAVFKNAGHSFILSDGVCIPNPSDEQRRVIIRNASKLFFQMNPSSSVCNVSLLSAGGDSNANTNPELYQWWRDNVNGFVEDGVNLRLEQLDVALNANIRAFKKINGAVADVVVCPEINMGNCIWKCLTTLADGWMCGGVLTGAPIPVVLNSRGDSAESMLFSIQIANML